MFGWLSARREKADLTSARAELEFAKAELETAKAELVKAQVTLLRATPAVESQEKTPAHQTLPKLVDSALLLALGGAFAWVGGFFYYLGFYRRLGLSLFTLPMESPNRIFLPFIPFVLIAVCLICISFIFTQVIGPSLFARYPRLTIWISNSPMWFIAVVLLVWQLTRSGIEWPGTWLIHIPIIALSISASMAQIDLFDFSKIRVFPVLFTPFFVASSIIFSATGIGESAAEDLIEGRSSSVVRIVMKDTNSLLDGRSLVLIEIIGSQYYFVEAIEPAPDNPRLHIVPEAEIESVSTILHEDQLPSGSTSATPIP